MMEEIFKEFGFSVHTKDGRSGKTINMSSFDNDKYFGVLINLDHENNMFQLICGDIKYFGHIQLPYMSINRSKDDIKNMLDTMKYYHDLVEEYKPW